MLGTLVRPTLAARLKDLRSWLGISQRDLAAAADVAAGTIASWENGKVRELKVDAVRRIALVTGVLSALLTSYFAGGSALADLKNAGAAFRSSTPVDADIDPDMALFYEGWQLLTPEEKQAITNVMLRAALRRQAGDDA